MSVAFSRSAAEIATSGSTHLLRPLAVAEGYRGIWYANQPSNDEYRFKYSGGFATYPQQHIPIAIYSAEAKKTFFVYGGTTTSATGKRELLHMISYYDHETSMVPRPRILLNKRTEDAHDNPTLQIDAEGYLWVFSNSHGTGRPTYLHRSVRPYSIDEFEEVPIGNFSYSQPWYLRAGAEGQDNETTHGFLFLHTRYQKGRSLYWMTSSDGREWSDGKLLSRFGEGHYQVSWPRGGYVGTAFNYHPKPGGLNARTNLYFIATSDMGRSWHAADGRAVMPPLSTTDTIALVQNYESQGLLVYLKDLNYDAEGNPVILYLTSRGYASGPKNNPRTWRTAHWTGGAWRIRLLTSSDNNYDFGSLYIEDDGRWRVIAPTETGPQGYNPGGEVVMWTSSNEGETWSREWQITTNSRHNHTYVRRPLNAHPDFYALWADGDAREPSDSELYFTNRAGSNVWRLPVEMTAEVQRPEVTN